MANIMQSRRRRKIEDLWRPIPGFGGMYEASFDGRIRKVKGMKQGEKKQFLKGKVFCVRLAVSKTKTKEQRVHVLVARAWLGEKPQGLCIYHKNGVRTDNFANNLAYVSRSVIGKKTGALASKRAVLKLDEYGKVLEVFPSARAAAKVEPLSFQAIIDRCNGKVKNPSGFFYAWEKSDDGRRQRRA